MLQSAGNALRSRPATLLHCSHPSSSARTSGLQLIQTKAKADTKAPRDMGENNPNKTQKEGDVMSNSFGEGYSTRSDEEGFGGIYSENQTLPDSSHSNAVKENDPGYDKSQGSEVKEKERGRHQTNAQG